MMATTATPCGMQFSGHGQRVAFEGQLDDLFDWIPAGAERVAFRDLDDEAAAGAHHQLCRVLGGDDVRHQRVLERPGRVRQIGVPEPSKRSRQRILAGDAVHDDVDAAVLAVHSREQRFDLALHGVVHADRDRRAAGGADHLGGLVDRLRTLVGRRVAFHASPRAVDDRAGFAQCASDAAAGAARGAGDDGHRPARGF